jgi:hypothetical protein
MKRWNVILALRTSWLPALALATALYLIYSPVFLSDYLMNDEWHWIGTKHGFRESARNAFFVYGRGLFGIYSTLVYRFVQYDPFRIELVRFINFASLATIAITLFAFLRNRTRNDWFSFLVVLFLFSQRCFQGAMAYSLQLIANTQPAMWLSLCAFWVQFYVHHIRLSRALRLMAVFVLLVLAMQSTQTYAFFAMVPLTYLTLTDWKNQRERIGEFLLVSTVVFAMSALVYYGGLTHWHRLGQHGYNRAEQALEVVRRQPLRVVLRSANPLSYSGAFEIWSYPFPFHLTLPLGILKMRMASLVMLLWGALLLTAVLAELRAAQQKKEIALKWLAVLVYLGFGAIFIAADVPSASSEHRPHLFLCFVGVATFSAAYALQVVASEHTYLKRGLTRFLAVIFVLICAFGAQAAILRGFVANRVAELDFIRSELISGSQSNYSNIIVVLPHQYGCLTEPCGPWMGHVTESRWHLTGQAGYRYALATLGIAPEKKISFVDDKPSSIAADTIVADWQKFVATACSRQHLDVHKPQSENPASVPCIKD